MFLIPRRPGESVILDDEIILTVLDVRGDKVRLAIEAPPHMSIERGEALELKLATWISQMGSNVAEDRREETN